MFTYLTSIPPSPPFSPSLISLVVSADVKHRVYTVPAGPHGEIVRRSVQRTVTSFVLVHTPVSQHDHRAAGKVRCTAPS